MNNQVALDGTARRIELGAGFALRAQGLKGSVQIQGPPSPDTRGPERPTPALSQALENALISTVRTLELNVRTVPAPAAEAPLRGPAGDDALELEVPDLGSDFGQVVLQVDENGVATWHFPLTVAQRIETPQVRGAGGVKKFRIRRFTPAAAPTGVDETRGLVSLVGRKVLKVLVFRLADPVLGPVSDAFAQRWEVTNRPYGLHRLTPENYSQPRAQELTPADWPPLAGGRSLWFIHGTFSTAHDAFCGLSPAVVEQLNRRYQQRVFSFNHFSLSHGPSQNVRWLLDQLPNADPPLEIDIISHSRGGLVARVLAEPPAPLAEAVAAKLRVRRVVFVGTPNHGTLLADPDHMVEMIDRFTTALNLMPAGNVEAVLEGILVLVKLIGHAALKGLDGLASMRPGGEFLQALAKGPKTQAEYYAISADFAPPEPGFKAFLAQRVADKVADRIFGHEANDLVVPTEGVFMDLPNANFPIPNNRLLRFGPEAGVCHTTYFRHPKTCQALLEWLQ